jgi:hypothetical protein
MCLDPTLFGELLRDVPVYDVVVGVLIGLVLMLTVLIAERRQNKQRRSRVLDAYRQDVYQVQQAAKKERDIAEAACLRDLYRIMRKE